LTLLQQLRLQGWYQRD